MRIAGLTLLIALLGWATWEAQWTPRPAAPPDTAAEAAAEQITPAQQFAPLSDYRATLERPLFYPGRQLPNEAAVSAEDPADNEALPLPPSSGSRLTLSAVIEENGKRSALLTAPGQATGTRLQEGERIGDWRLMSITEDSVILEANGRREQLPLRSYGAPPPSPTPTRMPARP
jgi:hypothetical protein